MIPPPASPDDPAAPDFLPLHKRALGTAFGVAAALVVFLITALYILRHAPESELNLGLLSQYFAGYSVSWPGAFIGAAWAGFTGFVLGWFLAFWRNLTMAILLVIVRVRAELSQSRDFLDQI